MSARMVNLRPLSLARIHFIFDRQIYIVHTFGPCLTSLPMCERASCNDNYFASAEEECMTRSVRLFLCLFNVDWITENVIMN